MLSDQDIEMEKMEQLQGENVVEVSEDCQDPQPPAAELLWIFNCNLTEGQSVTAMARNKTNPVTQKHFLLSIFHPSLCFL